MLINVFFILIAYPSFSSAVNCYYNESSLFLRKTILLQTDKHQYLRIYNASFKIHVSDEPAYIINEYLGIDIHHIRNITFAGNIVEGTNNSYINVSINSLPKYHYTKDNISSCSVVFEENIGHRKDITINQETAIVRIAESCIEAYICNIELYDIDKDADIYYQSTQSVINEIIDFYIPRIIRKFTNEKGEIELPNDIGSVNEQYVTIYITGGHIAGLDTLQRLRDISIQRDGNRFTIGSMFRFGELHLVANMKISKLFGFNGIGEVIVQGLVFKVKLEFDFSPNKCKGSLISFEIISTKNFYLILPIIKIKYHIGIETIQYYLKLGLDSYMADLYFDCEHYTKMVPDKIKEYIGISSNETSSQSETTTQTNNPITQTNE